VELECRKFLLRGVRIHNYRMEKRLHQQIAKIRLS
jgi:hypothetical protein